MTDYLKIKDHQKEKRLFANRVILAGTFVAILFLALIIRLVYLQIIKHEIYTTLSHNNQVTILPIPPTRGLIFDRHGVLLAENIPSFNLEVIPERIEQLSQTIEKLSSIISITDKDRLMFAREQRRKRHFESIPLKLNLTENEVATFAVNQYRFPGVEISARLTRHYPLGDITVHALGYVGRINEKELTEIDSTNYRGTFYIGKLGIEKQYEDLLHGKVGYKQVETDAHGRVIRTLERVPPEPGKNLYLSLDIKLQKAAIKELGLNRGAVVALDPHDGAVLALVSLPSYDPNLFVNGIDQATYASLRNSPNQPLFNRAVRGQYAPASTIKPIVGLAALDAGTINPNTRIFDPGYFQLDNQAHQYRDWKKNGHGMVNLEKAIVESCDTFFYRAAQQLGIQRLANMFRRFGYGERTGLDIGEELPGLVPDPKWKRATHGQAWYPGETVITGIGQGFTLATPLQLAAAIATIANRGERFKPHLVMAIQDQNDIIQTIPKTALPTVQLSNPKAWDIIQEAMYKVVHSPNGTASRIASHVHFEIVSKTGTAQVFNLGQNEKYEANKIRAHLRDHSLYVAYAPRQQPKIAMATLVENSKGSTDIAAAILAAYLKENPH